MDEMAKRILWLACALLVASSCRRSLQQDETSAQPRFSPEQLEARFSWDLGDAYIDVSGYPPRQRAGYDVFRAKCSVCHSLARPINAPMVSREDWKRYAYRMHMKAQEVSVSLDAKDVNVIVDFLVYDSQVRKIGRKEEFDRESKRLDAVLIEVQKERDRMALEKGKEGNKSFTYTGERP